MIPLNAVHCVVYNFCFNCVGDDCITQEHVTSAARVTAVTQGHVFCMGDGCITPKRVCCVGNGCVTPKHVCCVGYICITLEHVCCVGDGCITPEHVSSVDDGRITLEHVRFVAKTTEAAHVRNAVLPSDSEAR